jgi:branched-chain amino acid transport system substrate-binding protein
MAHRRRGLGRTGAAVAFAAAILATGILAGGTSAKSTKPSQSKGTLTIGLITSVGGQIIDYPFTVSSVIAGIRAINKAGGVNGYKLALFYCNTQGNPNQEVACARQAVERKVVATVGGFVFTNPQGYYQTLKDASIADVGQLRGSVQSFTFDNSFPLVFTDAGFAACLTPSVLNAAGSRSTAVVAADTPATLPIINLIRTVAQSNDLPSPRIIRVPVTATDLAPYAQQAAGVGVVVGAFPGAATVAFLNAARSVGARFSYCTTQGIVSLQPWVDLGRNVGNVFVGVNHDTQHTKPSNPLIQRFLRDMRAQQRRGDKNAYLDKNFNSQELNAWLGVQAVRQVVASMRGPVTSATFLRKIRTSKLKFNGVIPAVDFRRCISAGPYDRVFNWVGRAAKWNSRKRQFDLIPRSQFDALRYTYGRGASRSGKC